jgi:hypothetical protein
MKAPEELLVTIETIVKSQMLECYNIGITANPTKRRAQYKNWTPTWPHFAVIEAGLSRDKAIDLEKALQTDAWKDKRSQLYKKYRNDSRDGPYRPSTGGVIGNTYCVYVCWCNVGDN